ncbi:MAG: DNA mismatch repair protein MutS, partial [cyanobacterium endosymbiont of Rhopalodia yunnanensis]
MTISPDSNSQSKLGTSKSPHTSYRNLDFQKLTPMYQHYVKVKCQYPNALLVYRVGDFFECFFQDAVIVSQELELALTSKEGGKEIGRIAMTGVPHFSLERYSRLLIEKGYALAICDQVEDSSQSVAQGRMVERKVTKLLTPGTLTDDGMLQAKQNNFLAAVVVEKGHWGLSYADISTGEFFTTQGQELANLNLELLRLQPSEILVPSNVPNVNSFLRPGEQSEYLIDGLPNCFCYSLRSQSSFTLDQAKPKLLVTFGIRSLEGMGCEHLALAIRSAGGLLEYIEDTQKVDQISLQPLRTYNQVDFLILDHQTRRNLEITQTVRDGTFHGSLLWALDRTCTAMGGRVL